MKSRKDPAIHGGSGALGAYSTAACHSRPLFAAATPLYPPPGYEPVAYRTSATMEQLNALTLSRQGLLNPFPRQSVSRTVSNIGVLHGQIISTAPVQLWARVKGFRAGNLWSALYSRHTVVRTWAMRGTLHIIPSDMLEIYLSAIGPSWLNIWSWARMELQKVKPEDLEKACEYLVSTFERGPATRKELKATVHDNHVNRVVSRVRWEVLLRILAYRGAIIRSEMRGPEVVFSSTKDWLGREIRLYDQSRACADLLEIYLRTLGPASPRDFAHWTSLQAPQVREAFSLLDDSIAEVAVIGGRRNLFVLRRDIKALERAIAPEDNVRLLPQLDPVLLGHADRTPLVDPEFGRIVFGVPGDVSPTVLVAGRVAGTWRHERRGKTLGIRVSPFRRFDAPVKNSVRELSIDLASVMGFPEVAVEFE